MEIADLSLLRTGETGLPIEARVLRKWRPLFRDNKTHFILVDKHGNGIQAIAKNKDQQFVEGRLRLLSCYRIEKYACTDPKEYVNTLTHRTNLRIGTASSITPLADNEDLPRNYFEFGSRRKLELICGNKKEFTDYIGLLQGIEDKTTNPENPYVLLKLTDSRYNGERDNQGEIGEERITGSRAITVTTQRQTTIEDLLHKERHEVAGQRFTINASIVHIATAKDWYQAKCPKCNSEMYRAAAPQWFCTADGMSNDPKFIYRISAILSDDTGEINATIFDEALKTLTGISCFDLITKEGYDDNKDIPLPLQAIKGKKMKFHVQGQKASASSITRCTVSRVTQLETPVTTPAPHTPQPDPRPVRPDLSSTAKRPILQNEGDQTGSSKKSKQPASPN